MCSLIASAETRQGSRTVAKLYESVTEQAKPPPSGMHPSKHLEKDGKITRLTPTTTVKMSPGKSSRLDGQDEQSFISDPIQLFIHTESLLSTKPMRLSLYLRRKEPPFAASLPPDLPHVGQLSSTLPHDHFSL